MNPQLTVFYVEQQTNRDRLDQMAYQGWLAKEAAAHRDSQAGGRNAVWRLGRQCGRLVHQIVGGMSEYARAADEAIVPYR